MKTQKLDGGTVHELPDDLKKMLLADRAANELWQNISSLARNEWICWVISPKKAETRAKRIEVGRSKMNAGEKRPCCWVGCIHRTDKKPGAWAQKVLIEKQLKPGKQSN